MKHYISVARPSGQVIMETTQEQGIKYERQQYRCQYGDISQNNLLMGTNTSSWEQNCYYTTPFDPYSNYINSGNGSYGTSSRALPYNSEGYFGNYGTSEPVCPSIFENDPGFYPTHSFSQCLTPPMYNGSSCRYGHSNFPRFVF